MTEKDFWVFLRKAWEKGRAQQITGVIDCSDPQMQKAGEYLQGHALLPADYDQFCQEDIIKMGALLFEKSVKVQTKEAILIILAHQPSETALTILAKYNLCADKEGLEFFSKMALDECAMWNG